MYAAKILNLTAQDLIEMKKVELHEQGLKVVAENAAKTVAKPVAKVAEEKPVVPVIVSPLDVKEDKKKDGNSYSTPRYLVLKHVPAGNYFEKVSSVQLEIMLRDACAFGQNMTNRSRKIAIHLGFAKKPEAKPTAPSAPKNYGAQIRTKDQSKKQKAEAAAKAAAKADKGKKKKGK